MFGEKQREINKLNAQIEQWASTHNAWKEYLTKETKTLQDLMQRLRSVTNANTAYRFFTTPPLDDLRYYVELRESEKKQADARIAEEAKQAEIRRLADEEIAKHVAKLHTKKK